MKNLIKKLVAITATTSILCTGVMGATASAATDANVDENVSISGGNNVMSPMVHYDYDIPDFFLVSGETAFTTRYGYGFEVNRTGLNHNDFDITFNVSGSSVNLTLAVLTLDNYVNGNYTTYVATKTVTGAGYKEVNFNNLNYGNYVIKWINNNQSRIDISGANLSTSY